MKIKKTTWFKMIVSFGIIATFGSVFPIVLTSCSLKKTVDKFKYPTQEIKGLQPTEDFLSLTTYTWKELGKNNPEKLISKLKKANYDSINKSGFDLDNAFVYSVTSKLSAKAPILSDLYIQLINQKQNRSIILEILDIYNVSADSFTAPSNFNYTISQLDLKNIDELDPQNISDTQWTNAINLLNPEAIPLNVYMLYSRGYNPNNSEEYLLTYQVNPIYNNLLASKLEQFQPIEFTVKVSPYLNKDEQTDFNFNSDIVSQIFGNDVTSSKLIQTAANSGGQVEIYNKLADYISKNMTSIQPLRPCIDEENNTVYGFSIEQIKPSSQDICVIEFRTNPNSETRKFSYTFTLTMPQQNS